MIRVLIFFMVAAALAQFGMTVSELSQCRSRECVQKVEKHSRDVLKIDWKPITLFPEEAKKFR